MNIAVLGTGVVGQAIATRLIEQDHAVSMGSRAADNPAAVAWAEVHGEGARAATFGEAAAAAELLFLAVKGEHATSALDAVPAEALDGKILVDLTNPLDGSGGGLPVLSVSGDDSLGEQLQRRYPDARVVKTLNTLNAELMVNPRRLPEATSLFLSGDDEAAKLAVADLLEGWGWRREHLIDLGDITTARGAEGWLPLWLRLWRALGTADFNLRIVRAPEG